MDKENQTTGQEVQTRSGPVTIAQDQKGVPFREYFQNAELPRDPSVMVVFDTAQGPVLGNPPEIAWENSHDVKAAAYAAKLVKVVETQPRYLPKLSEYARELARETNAPFDQAADKIRDRFADLTGKPIKAYQDDIRMAKGLPVGRERGQNYGQGQ